jgi:beta-phosphoglucomutase-like phosphatase (HAD superfamily)
VIGLPDRITALPFDLDGVLTRTATVHAAAWKQMFDAFLRERDGERFRPFDAQEDYNEYVDGKPRYDGVRSFLRSRGIPDDDELVRRLGDRKNELVLGLISTQGVEVYDGSVRYLRAAREAGCGARWSPRARTPPTSSG